MLMNIVQEILQHVQVMFLGLVHIHAELLMEIVTWKKNVAELLQFALLMDLGQVHIYADNLQESVI